MASPHGPLPARRRAARPPASFQPRFTLALVYLTAFFFAFALLLAAPPLVSAFRALPDVPNEGDLELASHVAREALRGRLWLALAAALLATAAGARAGALPGLRRE
jgi:hypothetical protein